MPSSLETIKTLEEGIERTLNSLEVKGQLPDALSGYRDIEGKILALHLGPQELGFSEQQRVLAYCLMREANLLRQLGSKEEAAKVGERELAAARRSGDSITLARSLMSNGTTKLVAGDTKEGLGLIDEARPVFERGDTFDHKQGLGWYWILQADLRNANMIAGGPVESIKAANHAIELLTPLENWPGVARGYAARAKAHETAGDLKAAEADRVEQAKHEKLVSSAR